MSPGLALIVPRRYVARWSEATEAERQEPTAAIAEVQRITRDLYQPAGFNVGFYDGLAAGQTVGHLHIHVIPRHKGDIAHMIGWLDFTVRTRSSNDCGRVPGPDRGATEGRSHAGK